MSVASGHYSRAGDMSETHAGASQPVGSQSHTVGLLVIIVAWAFSGVVTLANLRADTGPPLILVYSAAMILDGLIVGYVVEGIRSQGGSLRELIGGSWGRVRDFWRDVLVAIVFWLVALVCLGALRLALHVNRSVDVARLLAPYSRVEIVLWMLMSLTAGFCEEVIFRGYLQRQFIAWSGKPFLGILLSAAVFASVHAYQGAGRAVIVAVFGAMFGILAYWRRSLRPGIMAHARHDTIFGLAARLIPR
jgi:membrane protease YdiL (CAAX protease family)